MPLIDFILTFKRPSDPFCLFSLFCPLNSPTLPVSVFMTPNHYSSSFSPFPIDLNEDQNQQLFNYHHAAPEVASSSSSQPYLNITNLTPEGGPCYHTESESLALPHEKEANLCTSYDHTSSPPKNENHNVLRLSVSKKEGKQENKRNNISVKWTPSKMRLVKKMMMMSSDQASTNIPERSTHKVEDHEERSSIRSSQDSPNNNSTSNTVRVCSDCNTTKTPLWRSGPRGPKSLCNACGIRQRKARRAAMAAAAGEGAGANNSTLFAANSTPTMKNKAQYKERKIKNSHLPFKKRCKFTAARGGSSSKKLCFEDLTIILNNNSSAFQRVFPQDEKEAAILLMALSYGLVHG